MQRCKVWCIITQCTKYTVAIRRLLLYNTVIGSLILREMCSSSIVNLDNRMMASLYINVVTHRGAEILYCN
jgi:hypothetical protein